MAPEPPGPRGLNNSAPLHLELRDGDGDEISVALRGELDLLSGPQLLELIDELESRPGRAVVLHFADVTFVDSSGINAMLALHRALEERERSLQLRDVQPTIRRTLKIAGVDDLLGVA